MGRSEAVFRVFVWLGWHCECLERSVAERDGEFEPFDGRSLLGGFSDDVFA